MKEDFKLFIDKFKKLIRKTNLNIGGVKDFFLK